MTNIPMTITVPLPATYVSSFDGTGKGEVYHHDAKYRAAREETDFQTERLRVALERAEAAEAKVDRLKRDLRDASAALADEYRARAEDRARTCRGLEKHEAADRHEAQAGAAASIAAEIRSDTPEDDGPPETTFDLIRGWAWDRNLIEGSNSQAQMLKLAEEIGELAGGIARGDEERIVDGIGDAVVVLTILAEQNDVMIEACLSAAWREIKDRKGRMVDGVFVKEGD